MSYAIKNDAGKATDTFDVYADIPAWGWLVGISRDTTELTAIADASFRMMLLLAGHGDRTAGMTVY